jgi:hypothetical protein
MGLATAHFPLVFAKVANSGEQGAGNFALSACIGEGRQGRQLFHPGIWRPCWSETGQHGRQGRQVTSFTRPPTDHSRALLSAFRPGFPGNFCYGGDDFGRNIAPGKVLRRLSIMRLTKMGSESTNMGAYRDDLPLLGPESALHPPQHGAASTPPPQTGCKTRTLSRQTKPAGINPAAR